MLRNWFILLVTVLLIWLGVRAVKLLNATRLETSAHATSPSGGDLEQAVIDAQRNVQMLMATGQLRCGMGDLSNVVKTINAIQGLTPEDEKRVQRFGRLSRQAILHVTEHPTGAWQVVLTSGEGTIRISGYGDNLTGPLIVRDVKCR